MKSHFVTIIIIMFVFASLFLSSASACSTFTLKNKSGEIVFGRNFDYPTGLGYITENKRNVLKSALAPASAKKLEWTSKYGSISFNQFGAEFPYGGMNEAGLVIEQMWFNDSKSPPEDDRYRLSALQWIQYQLDMSGSIDDVIKSDDLVTINSKTRITLHFLVCDQKGNTATIEFIAGKMVYHRGESLPVPALTNESYQSSCDYLNKFTDFGGTKELKSTSAPYDRFAVIADKIKNYDQVKKTVDYAFDILKSVTWPNTRWSIVYDITNKTIHFKTKENVQIRSFKLSSFYFNNKTPRLNMNIDAPFTTVKQTFIPYSSDTNLKHLIAVYESLEIFKGVTKAQIEMSAGYPETLIFK